MTSQNTSFPPNYTCISTFKHSYPFPRPPSTQDSHPLLSIFGCVMSPTTICLNQLAAQRSIRWSENSQVEALKYLYTKVGLRGTCLPGSEGNKVCVERYGPALRTLKERFGFLGNVDSFARTQVGREANKGFVPPTPPTFSKLLEDYGSVVLAQYAKPKTVNYLPIGMIKKDGTAAIRLHRSGLNKYLWADTAPNRSRWGIYGTEMGNMMHGYDGVPVELLEEGDKRVVSVQDGEMKARNVRRLARRIAVFLAAWTWDFAMPWAYCYPSDLL